MIRKAFLAFVIFSLLAGCAPAASATPTAVADIRSLATPQAGAVTVLSSPGKTTLPLASQPAVGASAIGQVKAGDTGKLLGLDASGTWMLVEIKQQTGWIPVQYLDYTIAQ